MRNRILLGIALVFAGNCCLYAQWFDFTNSVGMVILGTYRIEGKFNGCIPGRVIRFASGQEVECLTHEDGIAYNADAALLFATEQDGDRVFGYCNLVVHHILFPVDCNSVARNHASWARSYLDRASPSQRPGVEHWIRLHMALGTDEL